MNRGKTKVLMIVNSFPTVSETFVISQITGLMDLGVDVRIYAFRDKKDKVVHPDFKKYRLKNKVSYANMSENALVRVISIIPDFLKSLFSDPINTIKTLNFMKYGMDALSLRLLYAYTRFPKGEFDIIHCQFGTLGQSAIVLRDLEILSGKIVTSFRGFDISGFIKDKRKNPYKKLFKKGDLFLPVSKYFKARLIRLGCPKNKILVHYSGIDTSEFPFTSRKTITKKNFYILSIGRLVEKKGFEYSITAVSNATKKLGNNVNIIYKIVGDGPLFSKLQKLIDQLDANDSIELMGSQKRDVIQNLVASYDLMIVPSVTAETGDQEGVPVVLMEALAAGIPTIATKHSGIPEFVVNKKTGILVPERSTKSLTKAITHATKSRKSLRNMGKNASKLVHNGFDNKLLHRQLLANYKLLLKDKNK